MRSGNIWKPREDRCPLCNGVVPFSEGGAAECNVCRAPWRTRSSVQILEWVSTRLPAATPNLTAEVLAFSLVGAERAMVERRFDTIDEVSLYGNYGSDNKEGVDARDLSEYADNSYLLYFSVLCFDYFVEHKKALAEAYRVLCPGGYILNQISAARARKEYGAAEIVKRIIRRAPSITKPGGYMWYVPPEVDLYDIRVGIEWEADTMRSVGFEVTTKHLRDPWAPTEAIWFLGRKPK